MCVCFAQQPRPVFCSESRDEPPAALLVCCLAGGCSGASLPLGQAVPGLRAKLRCAEALGSRVHRTGCLFGAAVLEQGTELELAWRNQRGFQEDVVSTSELTG